MLRLLRPLSPLDRVPPAFVTAGMTGIVAGLGWLDHVFGTRAGLSVLYPVPVAIAAWAAGRQNGLLVAATAMLAWLLADLASGASLAFSSVATQQLLGHVVLCVIVALTVSALRRTLNALEAALERERTIARHDPLTGLVNSRAFRGIIDAELTRASRTGAPLTLAYLDADGFKGVNDTLGHSEGDRVLRAVAVTLLHVLRRTDTVARLGGDEFAILMPETSRDDAIVALAKARDALARAMAADGWPVTFSVGAVVAGALGTPAGTFPLADSLIAEADAAMFTAKRRGGDRVAFGASVQGLQGDLFGLR
ncbi:MAG: GGDEF domain-containing protein [Gemmatimonadetes bacterium]|nr:GGDEF domain-containing protein [Gemmatimonadota bacterium]